LAVKITVTQAATAFAVERSGSLYLWAEDFSGGWLNLQASTEAPEGIDFRLFEERAGLRVFVAPELLDLDLLRVELRRLPRWRLVALNPGSVGSDG